jgi:hypothetical protein
MTSNDRLEQNRRPALRFRSRPESLNHQCAYASPSSAAARSHR